MTQSFHPDLKHVWHTFKGTWSANLTMSEIPGWHISVVLGLWLVGGLKKYPWSADETRHLFCGNRWAAAYMRCMVANVWQHMVGINLGKDKYLVLSNYLKVHQLIENFHYPMFHWNFVLPVWFTILGSPSYTKNKLIPSFYST